MLLPLPKKYADLVYEEYDGNIVQATDSIRSFKLDKTWTLSVCAYLNALHGIRNVVSEDHASEVSSDE